MSSLLFLRKTEPRNLDSRALRGEMAMDIRTLYTGPTVYFYTRSSWRYPNEPQAGTVLQNWRHICRGAVPLGVLPCWKMPDGTIG